MSIPQFAFDPNSIVGWLLFNGLNISAFLVLGGIGLVALSAWGLSMVRVNSSIAFSPY